MSEVIHNTPQEFWRPPILETEGSETLAPACRRCGSEFMVDSRYCHVCGASRPTKTASSNELVWSRYLEYLKALEFHRIQRGLGLSTAALIAFLAGVGCLLGALSVGMIYSVQNLADFQAIQLWRIEWLLGALVAFAAGILLKRSRSEEQ